MSSRHPRRCRQLISQNICFVILTFDILVLVLRDVVELSAYLQLERCEFFVDVNFFVHWASDCVHLISEIDWSVCWIQ